MTDEIEVNPTQSGEGDVSTNAAPKVKVYTAKSCDVCFKEFNPTSANQKTCAGCREARDKKEHARVQKAKSRAREKATTFVYSSTDEPPKTQAMALLAARGIKHPHVQSTVYKLLLQEAAAHNIPANRFLFANGILQALRSYKEKKALPLDVPEATSTEFVTAELLTSAELYALYDASIATHEDISFQQFLEIRLNCKRSCYYLGKEIFQNDFADIHKEWSEWFPSFDPTTLPPQYTQKQAITWMASQSSVKDFLMLASRAAFKSSWSHCWIISALLSYPDCRVLLISETRPLAKDFIEKIRSYFEVVPGFETRFQRFFPEMTIPVGDGSVLSFENPMRRLRLPQSVESASMDQSVSGRRFDLGLFDDCISNVSCTNETQIAASVMKRDLLVKLREAGGGSYILTLGTPYGANDLYFQLIERSEKNKDETFVYRIDPAFKVKPEARHKLTPALLPTLTEDDIESYLFPERLNWRFLKPDLMNAPAFFMSQNLCIFPLEDDAEIRCQFEEAVLRSRIHHRAFFDATCLPGTPVYIASDDATSISRYADFSAVAAVRAQPVIEEGKRRDAALVVLDVSFGRWKHSEKITNICRVIEQHKPSAWVLEKDRGHEELVLGVRKMCHLKGLPMPHVLLRDIRNDAKSKAIKVKILEAPLVDGRLFFASAPWNDALVQQFIRFDGIRKSGSTDGSKDDLPDAVALAYQIWGPRASFEIDPEETQIREREARDEEERMRNQHFYGQMFGPQFSGTRRNPGPPNPPAPTWRELARGMREPEPEPVTEQQRSADPRLKVFGNKGPWRL
jgi:hypothetical protein